MSMKLKILGMAALATMAIGAFAAMNAGATVSGHFITGSEHTFVTGFHAKNSEHELHFISESGTSKIGCDVATYSGTNKASTKTATELTITPGWDQCYTTPKEGEPEPKWGVDENECKLVFKSRSLPEANDATVTVTCPAGKSIKITHPSCEITVAPQTVGGSAGNGVTYTNKNDGTAFVTMDVKVSLASTYHNGICVFLGTSHTSTMEGSVTIKGYSDSAHTTRTAVSAT